VAGIASGDRDGLHDLHPFVEAGGLELVVGNRHGEGDRRQRRQQIAGVAGGQSDGGHLGIPFSPP
jgi:hypothetical protein